MAAPGHGRSVGHIQPVIKGIDALLDFFVCVVRFDGVFPDKFFLLVVFRYFLAQHFYFSEQLFPARGRPLFRVFRQDNQPVIKRTAEMVVLRIVDRRAHGILYGILELLRQYLLPLFIPAFVDGLDDRRREQPLVNLRQESAVGAELSGISLLWLSAECW